MAFERNGPHLDGLSTGGCFIHCIERSDGKHNLENSKKMREETIN